MANSDTYHHTPAVHPALRSTLAATRCVCGGLSGEHFKGTGYCIQHCAGQCTVYRPTTAAQLSWRPEYE